MIAALNDQSGNGCAAGVASLISGVPDPFNQMSEGMSMEWKDQYKHPNWQRKRLEALDHSEWQCQSCLSTDKQLQVHHKQYFKDRMLWEYGVGELEVLCHDCHKEHHKIKDLLKQIISTQESIGLAEIVGLVIGFLGVEVDLDQYDFGPFELYEITYAIQPGKLAKQAIQKLSKNEVAALSESVRTIKRSPDVTGELRIDIEVQRGFVDF